MDGLAVEHVYSHAFGKQYHRVVECQVGAVVEHLGLYCACAQIGNLFFGEFHLSEHQVVEVAGHDCYSGGCRCEYLVISCNLICLESARCVLHGVFHDVAGKDGFLRAGFRLKLGHDLRPASDLDFRD